MHISLKRPIIGGFVFAVVMGFSTFIFGEISGFQARELLATSMTGIFSLCYVIILGSIYILVMILYLLKLSIPKVSELRQKHYNLLLTISKIDTILIVIAIIILLLLNIPFTETKSIPDSWYSTIYYLILAIASILGGGFITVITMIYQTISNIIHERVNHHHVDVPEIELPKEQKRKIIRISGDWNS